MHDATQADDLPMRFERDGCGEVTSGCTIYVRTVRYYLCTERRNGRLWRTRAILSEAVRDSRTRRSLAWLQETASSCWGDGWMMVVVWQPTRHQCQATLTGVATSRGRIYRISRATCPCAFKTLTLPCLPACGRTALAPWPRPVVSLPTGSTAAAGSTGRRRADRDSSGWR